MFVSSLAFVAVLVGLAAPMGKASHARIASVESRVEAKKLATRDPRAVLRADLERELAAIDWKSAGVKAPFEILAVLADAESSAGKEGAQASCTVQVVLREPGGALLGIVNGRASGHDAGGGRASLELDVLEAAARRASLAIPEAVRVSRKAR